MAYRLSQKKKQFFVAIHVIAAASWIGGTLGMLVLGIHLHGAANTEQLAYTLASMEIIDENLLKYPALLTLLTGILLSVWTQWGLVRHYWVLIKLVTTIVTIMIGILFLNQWTASLVNMVHNTGIASLGNKEFQSTWLDMVIASGFNLLCLFAMVLITYYKPFGKIRKRRASGSPQSSGRS